MTDQLALKLARDQDGMCPWCLRSLPADLANTEVDHIIPKSLNGPNLAWNRQVLHKQCNRDKRATLTAEAEAMAHRRGVPVTPRGGDTRPLGLKQLDCDYRLTSQEREDFAGILNAMNEVGAEGTAQQRAAKHAGARAVDLNHWWFLFTRQLYRELQMWTDLTARRPAQGDSTTRAGLDPRIRLNRMET